MSRVQLGGRWRESSRTQSTYRRGACGYVSLLPIERVRRGMRGQCFINGKAELDQRKIRAALSTSKNPP